VLRQVARRQEIYSYAEQILESDLKSAQIEERGSRERIDQKVQVAVLAVSPMQDRPKNARIPGSAFVDQAANLVAMKVQRSGRFQMRYLVKSG
jgi:hypothetical protein